MTEPPSEPDSSSNLSQPPEGQASADPAEPDSETHPLVSRPVQAKDIRAWRLLRERRHQQFGRAALVGLAAGAVAVLFQYALAMAEDYRFALLDYLHASHPYVGWMVLPVVAGVVGAVVGWATARFAPEAAGSGIPNVKGVLAHVQSFSWQRLLPVKFIGGVLAIGSGFSLGREGPTVQMGAAVGRAIADLLRVSQQARGRLIACGAGAGLAAAFNAPLAGFIFVIEELQREMSSLTYGTALIATVAANVVAQYVLGHATAFHISGYPMPPLTALPTYMVLGVVAGVVGVAFNSGLLWARRQCDTRFAMSAWKRAGLIGVLVGLVAWWLPEATGTGHSVAEQVLRGDYAAGRHFLFIFVLLLGKFVLTIVSYAAGVPGGIFAPMLLLGAALGQLVGYLSVSLSLTSVDAPSAFAVAGMAALFSSVVRAPLTGIVLVLEMTGNYEQLFPLLVACMTAYLVAERFRVIPVYDALLAYSLEQEGVEENLPRRPMLMEFVVEHDSFMDGRMVNELGLKKGCLLVTISRAGRQLVPHGTTQFLPGDHVTVVISGNVAKATRRLHKISRAPQAYQHTDDEV